jgi:3'-phosphoadenosine 5'-phosphosulfate sulfotransferase (PAPS reductase)/FAD synthetase
MEYLLNSKRPVIFCSFGKDSIALLDMAFKIRKDIDIVHLKLPYLPKRYLFAESVIQSLQLNVFNYPPVNSIYIQDGDYFDTLDTYSAGQGQLLPKAGGCEPYKEGEQYLCILRDMLNIPHCKDYEFNWDLILMGAKNGDTYFGSYKLHIKESQLLPNGKTIIYPLCNWTDTDVWNYIKTNNIPYNKERYDKQSDGYNDDRVPTCNKCMDYRNINEMVFCPKLKKKILSNALSESKCKEYLNLQIKSGFFERS